MPPATCRTANYAFFKLSAARATSDRRHGVILVRPGRGEGAATLPIRGCRRFLRNPALGGPCGAAAAANLGGFLRFGVQASPFADW